MPVVPLIYMIFGSNCAGKSTLAQELAERLPMAAHIEVDVLRYLVRGGLVAASRGASPADQPREYQRQCDLGVENALLLARNFAANGFSSVIEGLEDACAPGGTWQHGVAQEQVRTILLLCDDAVTAKRWRERNHQDLPSSVLAHVAWLRSRQGAFDVVLDSTTESPGTLARQLLR